MLCILALGRGARVARRANRTGAGTGRAGGTVRNGRREWLLPTVYERLSIGSGAMFAELRTVFPIFIRFGGIDFDDDPEAPVKLKQFVRSVQKVLDGYGGNLLQLTLGDKGAYVYGVFGSPIAHEDDARRAVRAAIEVCKVVSGTEITDPQIGISRGRVLSGTCGHPFRRTFACLGDPVNLAARLMSKADAGGILVTQDVADAAGDRFLWRPSQPLTLKGKSHTVDACELEAVDDSDLLRFDPTLTGADTAGTLSDLLRGSDGIDHQQ